MLLPLRHRLLLRHVLLLPTHVLVKLLSINARPDSRPPQRQQYQHPILALAQIRLTARSSQAVDRRTAAEIRQTRIASAMPAVQHVQLIEEEAANIENLKNQKEVSKHQAKFAKMQLPHEANLAAATFDPDQDHCPDPEASFYSRPSQGPDPDDTPEAPSRTVV